MKLLKPILFLAWFSVFTSVSHAGPSWQLVNPFLQNDGINSIVHNGTTFVAVGARGLVFSSPDGLIWTQKTSITTSDLNAVTWSPTFQQFVAVGKNGIIIFSQDAVTWEKIEILGFAFNDIIWNTGFSEYLIVGSGGTIFGLEKAFANTIIAQEFLLKTSTVTAGLNAITWDSVHNRYLIAGDGGTILTSPNGTTWTLEKDGIAAIAAKFTDIVYNNVSNKYFVSAENRGLFSSTADPLDQAGYRTWKSTGGLGAFPVNLFIYSIAVNPTSGRIVLMASPTNGRATIITSDDAVTWTQRASNIAEPLKDIFWDAATSQFMAGGQNSRILTSPDGITWTIGTSWVNAVINQMIYDPGPDPVNSPEKSLYISVGTKETILTSLDSIDWQVQQTNLTASFESVAFNPLATVNQQRYVVVGSGGEVLSSSDGLTWTTQTSGSTVGLYSVIWNPDTGKYIAVGNADTVISSNDGVTWVTENSGLTAADDLRAVAWDAVKAQYIAVGLVGKIWVGKRDVNGILVWVTQTSNTIKDLLAVTWDNINSQYVAVGSNETIAVGTFDVNSVLSWAVVTGGVSAPLLRSVIWDANGARYIIVGDAGSVRISTDAAVTWAVQTNINGRDLSTVIWDIDRKQYLAAGELGTILRRDIDLPVITLLGNNPADINQGIAFNDPGSTVADNIDVGLITSKKVFNGLGTLIGTDLGVVLPGSYRVEYDAVDASGNLAITKERAIIVVDRTPPVITLLDDRKPYPTPLNLPFRNPGTQVTDNVDKNLVANESGLNQITVTQVGFYDLTYDVTDNNLNQATTVVRTVEVVDDTTPPVMNVIGNSHLSRQLGTRYTDLGAVASDDVDGDITTSIVIDNPLLNINTNDQVAKETLLTIGTFTITYTATDRSGNRATAIRTVTVTPIIKDLSGGRLDLGLLFLFGFFLYLRKHGYLKNQLFA